MTFLALSIDKGSLVSQKADLEYQEMIYTTQYNSCATELSGLQTAAAATEDTADDNTTTMAALEEEEKLYDSKKTQIESQLEIINAEVESFEKASSSEVKTACKLNISG